LSCVVKKRVVEKGSQVKNTRGLLYKKFNPWGREEPMVPPIPSWVVGKPGVGAPRFHAKKQNLGAARPLKKAKLKSPPKR